VGREPHAEGTRLAGAQGKSSDPQREPPRLALPVSMAPATPGTGERPTAVRVVGAASLSNIDPVDAGITSLP